MCSQFVSPQLTYLVGNHHVGQGPELMLHSVPILLNLPSAASKSAFTDAASSTSSAVAFVLLDKEPVPLCDGPVSILGGMVYVDW